MSAVRLVRLLPHPTRAVAVAYVVCFAVLMTSLLVGGTRHVDEAFAVLGGLAALLGACLLGIMLGVWAPNLLAPVVAMVGLVAFNLYVSERDPERLYGPAMFWADWGPYDGSVWVGLSVSGTRGA